MHAKVASVRGASRTICDVRVKDVHVGLLEAVPELPAQLDCDLPRDALQHLLTAAVGQIFVFAIF